MKNQSLFKILLPNALLMGVRACLEEIFIQNSYSDKAVANMLKTHTQWGSRDRKTSTKLVYNITRNFLLYQYQYNELLKCLGEKVHVDKMEALMGFAMLEDEQLKDRLEIDKDILDLISQLSDIPEAIKYGLPDWVYDKILKDWGHQTSELIKALNHPAPVYIRYNSLKTTAQKLNSELDKMKADYIYNDHVGGAIRVLGNNQLRQSKAFKEGLFEFQDIGSQYIIKKIGVKPEQVVVDFCAGKGGKTLQLAGLMKNQGRLIASDIDATRLAHLQRRSERAGVKNLEIYTHTALIDKKGLMADIVLIDAPCSGSGTFRRQPDLKFRLKEEMLSEVLIQQANILNAAKDLLKNKGKLIYATCSIFKSENSEQIEKFLNHHPEFQLIEEEYLLPFQLDSDGFYVAILEKNKKGM